MAQDDSKTPPFRLQISLQDDARMPVPFISLQVDARIMASVGKFDQATRREILKLFSEFKDVLTRSQETAHIKVAVISLPQVSPRIVMATLSAMLVRKLHPDRVPWFKIHDADTLSIDALAQTMWRAYGFQDNKDQIAEFMEYGLFDIVRALMVHLPDIGAVHVAQTALVNFCKISLYHEVFSKQLIQSGMFADLVDFLARLLLIADQKQTSATYHVWRVLLFLTVSNLHNCLGHLLLPNSLQNLGMVNMAGNSSSLSYKARSKLSLAEKKALFKQLKLPDLIRKLTRSLSHAAPSIPMHMRLAQSLAISAEQRAQAPIFDSMRLGWGFLFQMIEHTIESTGSMQQWKDMFVNDFERLALSFTELSNASTACAPPIDCELILQSMLLLLSTCCKTLCSCQESDLIDAQTEAWSVLLSGSLLREIQRAKSDFYLNELMTLTVLGLDSQILRPLLNQKTCFDIFCDRILSCSLSLLNAGTASVTKDESLAPIDSATLDLIWDSWSKMSLVLMSLIKWPPISLTPINANVLRQLVTALSKLYGLKISPASAKNKRQIVGFMANALLQIENEVRWSDWRNWELAGFRNDSDFYHDLSDFAELEPSERFALWRLDYSLGILLSVSPDDPAGVTFVEQLIKVYKRSKDDTKTLSDIHFLFRMLCNHMLNLGHHYKQKDRMKVIANRCTKILEILSLLSDTLVKDAISMMPCAGLMMALKTVDKQSKTSESYQPGPDDEESELETTGGLRLKAPLVAIMDAVAELKKPQCHNPACATSSSSSHASSSDNSTKEEKLKRCSACRKVLYCTVACQRADWGRHKVECKQHVNK